MKEINVKSDKDLWPIWGEFCLQMKMELEKVLNRSAPGADQYLKWVYAYLQNKNQLVNINLKTRLGRMGMKRDLAKSSILLAQLITMKRKAAFPDEICSKVEKHLDQLRLGRYDTICNKEIYSVNYPKEYK